MKAPLIVAGPGIPARCQSTALVYLHDLFPTICQWAGVETPGQVDGTSLLPIIEGQRDSVRDSLFSSYGPYARAVRDDCWKLIRWPQIDKTQLFNLQADPDELCDLSDQPACRARVVEMLRMLSDWQADSGDLQPLVVDDPKPAEIDLTGRPRTPDEHQPEWVVQKYFDSSK